ncbi:MAG: phosphatidylinositol mannoside acyltransferase [Chloroflexota bacterium]
MALYLIIRIGALISRFTPRSWRYRVGTAVGELVFFIWREKRHIIISNMAQVLGRDRNDSRVRQLSRWSMRNHCKYLIEFVELPVLSSKDPIVTSMTVTGMNHLQDAIAQGRGVVMASAHFGTIELGGLRLKEVTSFHAVYDSFKPAYLDALIQSTRLDKGINLIPVNNVRAMLRVLQGGGTLVVLFDRPMEISKGIPVRFFGKQTAVPGGPAVLALKTGAAIVPVYMIRHAGDTFEARILPPIDFNPSGQRSRDIQVIMQKLIDTLQIQAALHPDQWYMFRSMWPEETAIEPATSKDMSASEVV